MTVQVHFILFCQAMSSHSIFDEFLQTCLTQGALSLPDSGPLAAEFALAPALKTSTVAEPRVDSALGSVVDSSGDQRVTEGQRCQTRVGRSGDPSGDSSGDRRTRMKHTE